MKPLNHKTLVLLAVVTTSNLSATTVASWDWNTPSTLTDGYTTPQAAGVTAAHVTVSDLGFGPGFGDTFPTGTQNSLGGTASWKNATTLAAAITDNLYWTFTVDVAPGYSLNLNTATVATGYGILNGGGGGYNSFLMSSATGFTAGTQLGSGANGYLWSPWGGDKTIAPYDVSLSAVSPLQNITSASGPIEFRVYMPKLYEERVGIQQLILDGAVVAAPPPVTVITSGTTYSAGTVGDPGTETLTGGLQLNTGSIFQWDLDATSGADPGVVANSGIYDMVTGNGTGDGIFKVVLGTNLFTNPFWDTDKSWTDIFSGTDPVFSLFSGGDGFTSVESNGLVAGEGQFSYTGGSLNWTAVPEPTSALAGLLLGAGLLRRRRNA
jgi:hypothetical protein